MLYVDSEIAGYFLSNIVFTESKGHTTTPVRIGIVCAMSGCVCVSHHILLRLNPLPLLIRT